MLDDIERRNRDQEANSVCKAEEDSHKEEKLPALRFLPSTFFTIFCIRSIFLYNVKRPDQRI